jgi:hypothetical protein
MGVKKRRFVRGGKNIIFRRGGGINIVFGPKYRPLHQHFAITIGDNKKKTTGTAALYQFTNIGAPISLISKYKMLEIKTPIHIYIPYIPDSNINYIQYQLNFIIHNIRKTTNNYEILNIGVQYTALPINYGTSRNHS